jgi:hypothetical protein
VIDPSQELENFNKIGRSSVKKDNEAGIPQDTLGVSASCTVGAAGLGRRRLKFQFFKQVYLSNQTPF